MNIRAEKMKQILKLTKLDENLKNMLVVLQALGTTKEQQDNLQKKFPTLYAEKAVEAVPELTEENLDTLIILLNNPAMKILLKNNEVLTQASIQAAQEILSEL